MADAPGTTLGNVTVVVVGAFRDGVDVGVDVDTVFNCNGARVADGISSTPMTTATATTPTPRSQPEDAEESEGSRPLPPSPAPEPLVRAGSSYPSVIVSDGAGRRSSRTDPGVGCAGAGASGARRGGRAPVLHSCPPARPGGGSTPWATSPGVGGYPTPWPRDGSTTIPRNR